MLYGLDGDKIGGIIDALFIENDLDMLTLFSNKVSSAIEEIKKQVLEKGGKVIFCGGDSILFESSLDHAQCEYLIKVFGMTTGRTASMGIGQSPTEVYLALKLAKAKGGGQIVHFEGKGL